MINATRIAKLSLGLLFTLTVYFGLSGSALAIVQSHLSAGRDLRATSYPSTALAAQSRDDRGCCVIKPTAVKTGWEYYDRWTRGSCVDAARKASVDWDFYKDKSCSQVKQSSSE
jgi:hypothetical protein